MRFSGLILIFILSLIPFAVTAQLSAGLSAGYVSSKLIGEAPLKGGFYPQGGFKANLKLEYGVSSAVSLVLKPGYMQMGSRLAYEDSLYGQMDTANIFIDINYLTLPFCVLIHSQNNKFYALGGLEMKYLLSANARYPEEIVDLSGNVNKYQVSAGFGVGYRLALGRSCFCFELSYSQSLNDLTKENPDLYLNGLKISCIELSIGFQYQLIRGKEALHE